jgi:hypothetical protein
VNKGLEEGGKRGRGRELIQVVSATCLFLHLSCNGGELRREDANQRRWAGELKSPSPLTHFQSISWRISRPLLVGWSGKTKCFRFS